MEKLNCWQAKNCGREANGYRSQELGVCRTAIEANLDGAHGGKNGGRACWVVAGTLCGGKEQGTFAQKYKNCSQCDFYLQVRKEEGAAFTYSSVLQAKMKGK